MKPIRFKEWLLALACIIIINTGNANHFVPGALSGIAMKKDTCKRLTFNTNMHELAPAVKNGYLYYTVKKLNREQYCIFSIKQGHQFSPLQNMGKKAWKQYVKRLKYVYVNFTPDGKTVLLNIINNKTGKKDLFTGNPVYLSETANLTPFPYNDKKYSTGRATISPDGKLLVFSSDRPNGEGNIDLWMCRNKNGKWQKPENLGDPVNTYQNETMPCFASNNRLFFASDGHKGQGGFDLFYSDLKDGHFTTPINMGTPVNSEFNECGICFSPQNRMFYFSSDRKGNYDIYEYPSSKKFIKKQEDNKITIASEPQPIPKIIQEKALEIKTDATAKEKNPLNTDKYFYAIQIMTVAPKTYTSKSFKKRLAPGKSYLISRNKWSVKILIDKRFESYNAAYHYAIKEAFTDFYIILINPGQILEYL